MGFNEDSVSLRPQTGFHSNSPVDEELDLYLKPSDNHWLYPTSG